MKSTAEYIALLHGYMQNNAEKYGISRIGIFGSVARNEHREESDVDVYIEGNIHGFFALSGIKKRVRRFIRIFGGRSSFKRENGFFFA